LVNQCSYFSIIDPILLPDLTGVATNFNFTGHWMQHVSLFPYLFAFLTMTGERVVMARPVVALHLFSSEKETT